MAAQRQAIRNVLFVCIGNICRSPMAEGLFARTLPGRAVCSAGVHALVGQPADPYAVALMAERGVDISAHRGQNLASWMARDADLIVTMDTEQKRYVERMYPAARGKVRRLYEDSRIDVPDPYRQGRRAFRHASGLIVAGIDELAHWIARHELETVVPDTVPPVLQDAAPLAMSRPPPLSFSSLRMHLFGRT